MAWIFLLLAFLALVAVLVYLHSAKPVVPEKPVSRPASGKPAPIAATKPAPTPDFWGKRLIVPDPARACEAVRPLHGRCYALTHLPELPVKGCTRTDCECQLTPLIEHRTGSERRSGQERREDVRFDAPSDRRSGTDRRREDHYHWHYTP